MALANGTTRKDGNGSMDEKKKNYTYLLNLSALDASEKCWALSKHSISFL